VQKFNLTGGYLGEFGGYGTQPGQMAFPTGIAVDEDGYVYVVDQGNSRIQKLTPQGESLSVFGMPGSGDGELNTPYGIAVLNQQVYITDQGNSRVQVFSALQ
jgi:DNA-binding beta-propeller fold protein YncE